MVDELPEERSGGKDIADGRVQLLLRRYAEVAQERFQFVIGDVGHESAGQAERVDEPDAQRFSAEAFGLVGDESKVKLEIVSYDDPILQMRKENRKLSGDGVVVFGRTGFLGFRPRPVEANAVVGKHGDFANPCAPVRAKSRRFKIEVNEGCYPERTIGPLVHG